MSESVHDAQRLMELQALPLERKIQITQARILEWNKHYNGKIVVSFSGGKDSTVLLDLVRRVAPDTRAVFSNTGLEYAEIQRFVKSFDNVDIVTPKMRFDQVISTYGYPLISKEVAEAIYYARRIRSQNGNVERERERESRTGGRKRVELHGERGSAAWNEKFLRPVENCNETSGLETSGNRGADLTAYPDEQREKPEDSSQRTDARSRGSGRTIHRRGNFGKELRKEYLREGNTGVVNEEAVYSMFNKEKYLPLARDVPVLISHLCCMEMKKKPMHAYQRKNKLMPILGTMAEESRVRKQGWIRHGCNAFESKNPTSQPLSFWKGQNVLEYIVRYGVEICSVYGEIVSVDEDGNVYPANELIVPACKLQCIGCQRTGCVFCGFGFHNDKGLTRFQQLALIEPRKYEYAIGGGQWVDNPYYDPTAPKMDGEWQNWNPKKIWVPSKKGLGMGKVFDMVNEIYGKDFYRYE